MAKFTDAVRATLTGYFNAGDQPTEAQFTALILAIQEGIEEHDHSGTGDGDGVADLVGPVGIGTPAPADELHIYDTSVGAHIINIDAKGSDAGQTAELNLLTLGDGTKSIGNAAVKGWRIRGYGDADAAYPNDLLISFWDGAGYNHCMMLDSVAQNVGFGGVLTPGGTVEIKGELRFSGTDTGIADTPQLYKSATSGLVVTGCVGTSFDLLIRTDTATLIRSATGTADLELVATTGNVGISTAVFGTNAVAVLGLGTHTVPTTSPANMIQLFSVDCSDAKATLGLRTEQVVEAGAMTPSHKLKVLINGTEYYMSLDAV